jgi:hypothetical protein
MQVGGSVHSGVRLGLDCMRYLRYPVATASNTPAEYDIPVLFFVL